MRTSVIVIVAFSLAGCASGGSSVAPREATPVTMKQKPALQATVVRSDGKYQPGTTIVDSARRRLYHYARDGMVYSFAVGIGREGFGWHGAVKVCDPTSGRTGIEYGPRWFPTNRMIEEDNQKPVDKRLGLAQHQKYGMPPGGQNPFGSVAIRLCHPATGQYVLLNIHGTPREFRHTIGQASSSGCFRMYDEEALTLARLIRPGDPVVVWPASQADERVGS